MPTRSVRAGWCERSVGELITYHLLDSEFLLNAAPKLYDHVEQIAELAQLPDFVLSEIEKEFVRYQCIGGMPAAVAAFMDGVDMGHIESSLRNILAMYRLDFSQYANPVETMRIAAVWDAVPSQLAKPNLRFFLSRIHANARSREFAPALQCLCEAGLVLKTCRVSTAKISLRAYLEPEIFKLYAKDVGLLRAMANLSSDSLLNPSVMSEFKGALAENLVAISLCRTYGIEPCYWASGEKAEVDFLIESAGQIFPLEVKAGKSVAGKSLSVYARKFDPSLTIRLSGLNLKKDDRLLNVPLALVDWLPKFIEMAL